MKRLILFLPLIPCALAQDIRILPAHTNMADVLLAPTKADARDRLGVTAGSVGTNVVAVVATFSDIPSVMRDPTAGPHVLRTRGFYSAGDQGGAEYVWVNSSAATNYFRIAASGGGRWVERDYLERGILNVLKCGATPFDTSSDSVAIQRAFDAAAQQSSGSSIVNFGDEPTVYFPVGRYYLDAPVFYGPTSRGIASIGIRGDGMWQTHFIVTTPLRTNGLAAFQLRNIRVNIRDFRIRPDVSGVPADFQCTGIHLQDGEYGVIENVGISYLSRGIVLDNPSMNWLTLDNIQFEANYIDVFARSGQGTHLRAHSTGSGHLWYGIANGCSLWLNYEGGGQYNEFIPAGIVIPDGNDIFAYIGYNEAAKGPLFAGSALTNRVTLSVAGTTVTATFTNAHVISGALPITVIAEQTVPSDVQSYIVGSRTTLSSANSTNNTVQFTAGGTVTSDLSGYTFLIVLDQTAWGILNSTFHLNGMTDGVSYMNRAENVRVWGSNMRNLVLGPGARNVTIDGAYRATTPNFSETRSGGSEILSTRAPNLFPDPHFVTGTSWIGPVVAKVQFAELVATNWYGRPAVLWYQTNRTSTSYPQYRADFNPVVPMSSLNGQRVVLLWEWYEPNYPSYQPTGFSVVSGGTGYVDGLATVSHGGRTVQVNLTTSSGAITAATWQWMTFVTNNVGALDVIQGSATGGQIQPAGYTDRSFEKVSYDRRVRLMYRGESTSTLGSVIASSSMSAARLQNGAIHRIGMSSFSLPIDGTKLGLRVNIHDPSMSSSLSFGTEAIVITYMALIPEISLHRIRDYFQAPYVFSQPYQAFSTVGWGSSFPAPQERLAFIFGARSDSGDSVQLRNNFGGGGWLMHYAGSVAAGNPMPTNIVIGATVSSNNVLYLWTGSSWQPF